MDKVEAIELLKDLKGQIPYLGTLKYENSQYKPWRTRVEHVLKLAFDEGDYEKFLKTGRRADMMIMGDSVHQDNYEKNLKDCETTLQLILDKYQILGERKPTAIAVSPKDTDVAETLRIIFSRFHNVVSQLQNRHASRAPLSIRDEYDVQDLLRALLTLYFDDIRSEEWTPSYAGSSSRMDFLLKDEQAVIEVKKASDDLRDKEIGQQLLVDIAHYKEHRDCKILICFIYDPEKKIRNPAGLKKDLSKTKDLPVKVFVYPT
jgi:hypothetical protein